MIFALVGYGLAVALFAVLSITSWHGRGAGGLFAAACGVTALWAGLLAAWAAGYGFAPLAIYLAEVLRDFAWLAFLARMIPSEGWRSTGGLARLGVWAGAALAVVGGIASAGGDHLEAAFIPLGLGAAVFGLVLLEQVYRNTRPERRWDLKFLLLGVGGLLAYDLFLFSHALLLHGIAARHLLYGGADRGGRLPGRHVAGRLRHQVLRRQLGRHPARAVLLRRGGAARDHPALRQRAFTRPRLHRQALLRQPLRLPGRVAAPDGHARGRAGRSRQPRGAGAGADRRGSRWRVVAASGACGPRTPLGKARGLARGRARRARARRPAARLHAPQALERPRQWRREPARHLRGPGAARLDGRFRRAGPGRALAQARRPVRRGRAARSATGPRPGLRRHRPAAHCRPPARSRRPMPTGS